MKERLKKLAPKIAFPLFYLFSFFVFLSWTFPYEKLKERLVVTFNSQQRASNGGQELQVDELDSYWLTGVEANGIHLLSAPTEPNAPPSDLKIDRARARISIFGLLMGNKDVSFKLDVFGGTVSGSYDDKGKERDVDIEFKDVDLSLAEPIKQMLGVPVEGKLGGTIELSMPEGKATKGSGKVVFEAQDIAVGDGKAKLKGQLALPRLNVGAFVFNAEAREGVLKITKLTAGGKDLELSGEGRVQLRELATDSGLDINMKIKVNDGYRGKNDTTKSLFGAPGSAVPGLFELADPRVKQAKRPDGFFGWHLRGTLGHPDFAPSPSAGGPAGPPTAPKMPQ